ncbi:MAG: hypothetical protein GF421_10975 [Candidatus Aminicenantes bacterium]|nr:hypothetical protein [Candidatus Aminicenantes bacterium]
MEENKEVTFGEWFLTIFLMAIPIVNLVLLFVWGFGSTTKASKANWAKATLAWMAIGVVFYLFVFVILLGIGINLSR